MRRFLVMLVALAVMGCDAEQSAPAADGSGLDTGPDGSVGGGDMEPEPDGQAEPEPDGHVEPEPDEGVDEDCGDGDLDEDEGEECDDGNRESGDGCDGMCRIETENCGNSALDPGEQCDDGDLEGGDGCDARCRTEVIDISAGGDFAGYLLDGEVDRYAFELALPARTTIETGGDGGPCPGDTTVRLYAVDEDGDRELIGENDDGGDGQRPCSRLFYMAEPGVYAVEVEFEPAEGQPSLTYVLTATFGGICGDGTLEVGEGCDDGNRRDGDGCDSACVPEMLPVCGDGQREGDEECDDGNRMPGDGCDADCRVEPMCGDGNLDEGEACDDGNRMPGDGCDADCGIEAVCGNGVLEPGESCDDRNTTGGDGCSAECRIEPGCGNGRLEAGEECDDGNEEAGDGCSPICRVEVPVCGDGRLDDGEGCDDGNRAGGDGCDGNCQIEEALCGNGEIEVGENCDDGNVMPGDGCGANCREEPDPVCGNGLVEAGETCDDGNVVSGDGCDDTCQPEVEQRCGNGVVEGMEECDDGNLNVGDGCAPGCIFEPVCGDGDVEGAEQCDDGNRMPGDGCAPNCTIEPAQVCGNGIVEGDEECDDGNRFFGDGCGGDCVFERIPECGNDYLDANEECDDGNRESGDGCDVNCRLEREPACGNGVVEVGEGCDDGGRVDGDGCDADCQREPMPVCGNGLREDGEQCDDGGLMPGDGCDGMCLVEAAACGNGRLEAGEECDDGGRAPGDGCDPECRFEARDVAPGDAVQRVDLPPDEVHIYALELEVRRRLRIRAGRANGCLPDRYALRVVAVADGAEVAAVEGELRTEGCVDWTGELAAGSYVIEVRSLEGDGGPYALTVEALALCANTVIEAPETCDDGNEIPGDGCDAMCVREDILVNAPGTYPGGFAAGGEDVFTIELPAIAVVTLQTGDGQGACPGDTRMSLARIPDVGAPQVLTSNDDGGVGPCSRISLRLQAGRYRLVVTGGQGNAVPEYALSVDLSGNCGDTITEYGEQCDDGGRISGDGCDDRCRLEYTDVGAGGLFGAGAPVGGAVLFGFSLDGPTAVTLVTGDQALLGPGGPASCEGIDTLLEVSVVELYGLRALVSDDDGGFPPGCSRIEAELPAGEYRVLLRHPDRQALPEHRIYFDLQPLP